MSGLVGAARPVAIHQRDDQRLASPGYATLAYADVLWCPGAVGFAGYAGPWWPRGNGLLGDLAVDVGVLAAAQWAPYEAFGGISSRVGFVGVTRDQYGSPLGNCVVQLFRTSDDLFIMEQTSDANGNFLLSSWYTPNTHYIVAYKAGSPDAFGTTVNTLVGA